MRPRINSLRSGASVALGAAAGLLTIGPGGAGERQQLGDLGLTAEKAAAIVAFLRTLSDGYALP